MPRVKLGDVAREYKATVKDSSSLPTVGLEHLVPGEISLEQWDDNADNTFTKGFKKGHMLFGRRRAYLKKAALAPFDGVCSGDITVIEAIPERILPDLLPFVIQNDALFDYAVGRSAGSLSPRVKWADLKDYEFALPEMGKQEELTDLLRAAYRTKKAYKSLLDATIGLEHLDAGTLTVSRWGSEVAPVGEKLIMRKGDVLFGKRRAYQKKVAIAPFDGIFSAHGMVLRPREDVITKEFFPLFINSDYFLDEAIRISVGSLSPTVNWKDLKDLV